MSKTELIVDLAALQDAGFKDQQALFQQDDVGRLAGNICGRVDRFGSSCSTPEASFSRSWWAVAYVLRGSLAYRGSSEPHRRSHISVIVGRSESSVNHKTT